MPGILTPSTYVIIVAGGSGQRMGGTVPKQFLLLRGKPILLHTLERIHTACPEAAVTIVLPAAHIATWHALCRVHGCTVVHKVVEGGDTRFDSVSRGLASLPLDADGVVAVHDGVRPFVSEAVVCRCIEEAGRGRCVVPVIQPVESLRRMTAAGSEAVDRSVYRLVQTPQAFPLATLRKAYAQGFRPTFTDDASVVEAAGNTVAMVEGNRENIKLTTPFDLCVAEALLEHFTSEN